MASRRSRSVKASAVLPAKPTRMSSPIFRTFFALGLTTMDPMLTCPSPILQTLPPRRTHKIVVPCISAADPNRRRSRDPPRGANNPRHRDAMNTTDLTATRPTIPRCASRSGAFVRPCRGGDWAREEFVLCRASRPRVSRPAGATHAGKDGRRERPRGPKSPPLSPQAAEGRTKAACVPWLPRCTGERNSASATSQWPSRRRSQRAPRRSAR